MRKVGIIVIVCLLAVTGIMAAMAYTSASVTNDMSVKLTRTAGALLALEASENHNAARYIGYNSPDYTTKLAIDLSRGKGDESFGIQDGSEYIWEDLFKVTNNSEHSVVVSISMDPVSQGRVNIYARGPEDAWKVLSGIHSSGGKVEFTLDPGGEQYIDMKATATNGWTAEYDWKLVVDAVTVNNS